MINLKTFDEFILESMQEGYSFYLPRKPKDFNNFEGVVKATPTAGEWWIRNCTAFLYNMSYGKIPTNMEAVVYTPEFGYDYENANPTNKYPPKEELQGGENPWEFVKIVKGQHAGISWISTGDGDFSDKPGEYEINTKKAGVKTLYLKPINEAPTIKGWGNSKGKSFNIKRIFTELNKQ